MNLIYSNKQDCLVFIPFLVYLRQTLSLGLL
nr:MAG TPA: hypothetical protein [Caudoviricetes sp.]DAR99723.1 MAG TPA: hypothetical protein [Caudoviricetes sp.]